MRILLAALALLSPFAAQGQEANTSVLTLVKAGEFNKMKVDIEVALGNSSDVTDLDGTIMVLLDIDPETGKTHQLTIQAADISGTDIKLSNGNFFGNYHFESDGLRLTAETNDPPGQVEAFVPGTDPPLQNFDADQHRFIVNQGTLAGMVNPFIGDSVDVAYDYATDPFEGSGMGSGEILLTPMGYAEGKLLYEVELVLPISLTQEIMVEGSPLSATANLGGMLKAIGTTFVELPDYNEWAVPQGLAEGSEGEFSLSPGIPNLHFFGLGFDASSAPGQLVVYRPEGMALKTAGRFARGDFELQWSTDLGDWVRVPDAEMVSGSSLITEGLDLENEIVAGFGTGAISRFYRLVNASGP